MPKQVDKRFVRADAIALATLGLTAVIVAWPLLAGGVETYVDNPVHLAEIHSLAFDASRGWSGMAYCGLPLGHLHSPLWYGALALLVRAGAPLVPVYSLALLLGFAAPALALYFVGRRSHLPVAVAALLASLLLVQRTSIVGLGAALGGMWTFYLGIAFWILLVYRMTRRIPSTRDLFWIAALVALITLTHLFLVIPTALLGAIHAVWLLRRPHANARPLALQAAAGVLGVLVAAVYWGPLLYTRDTLTISGATLSFPMVAARLFMPTAIVDLLVGRFTVPPPRILLEALPMMFLLVLGVAGAVLGRRRMPRVAAYGFAVSVLLFVLLTWGRGVFDFVSGPLSWRLLAVVRAGMALAAIPVLLVWSKRVSASFAPVASRVAVVFALPAALGVGMMCNQSLRTLVVRSDHEVMRGVHAVWDWLRTNATPEWGRVYVQDTLYTEAAPGPLRFSHVMARTASETSVHQLGAAYSAVPFPTARWTTGEFGMLYGMRLRTGADLQRLREAAWRSNTTHLVLCDPRLAARLTGTGGYEGVFRAGSFTVLRDVQARAAWAVVAARPRHAAGSAAVGSVDARVRVDSYAAGRVVLQVDAAANDTEILVKEAYHPFWRLQAHDAALPSTATLDRDDWGLLSIRGLTAGAHQLVVEYAPPRWPLLLSLLATGLTLLLALRPREIAGDA